MIVYEREKKQLLVPAALGNLPLSSRDGKVVQTTQSVYDSLTKESDVIYVIFEGEDVVRVYWGSNLMTV